MSTQQTDEEKIAEEAKYLAEIDFLHTVMEETKVQRGIYGAHDAKKSPWEWAGLIGWLAAAAVTEALQTSNGLKTRKRLVNPTAAAVNWSHAVIAASR